VAVIDPEEAAPEGQKILEESDAFITKGGRIVYINRHRRFSRAPGRHSLATAGGLPLGIRRSAW
jgi:hypothetical protein